MSKVEDCLVAQCH